MAMPTLLPAAMRLEQRRGRPTGWAGDGNEVMGERLREEPPQPPRRGAAVVPSLTGADYLIAVANDPPGWRLLRCSI